MTKQYLGDGVYFGPGRYEDEYILTTENGVDITNIIYLERDTLIALKYYIDLIFQREKEKKSND